MFTECAASGDAHQPIRAGLTAFPGPNTNSCFMEKVIIFRLKGEPRVTLTAPVSLVHDEEDGWRIDFFNARNYPQSMVMLSRHWDREDEQ